jgi:hypothetical protein
LFVEEFAPQQLARIVRNLPQPLFQRIALFAVQRLGAGGLGGVCRLVAGARLLLAGLGRLFLGVLLALLLLWLLLALLVLVLALFR